MAGYMRRGRSRYYYIPSIASSTLAPTVAEITAGTHLSAKNIPNLLVGVEGFSPESTFIEVEAFASEQTLKLPGSEQTADSRLTFLDDDTSNPFRTLLSRGVSGFLMFSPTGAITAGTKVDVFPITVGGKPRTHSAGNEAAVWVCAVGITNITAEDVAILA